MHASPQTLPDALALFHARFRLLFGDEWKLGYDGPSVAGLYTIDVLHHDEVVAVLEYDARREKPFGFSDSRHDIDFAAASEKLTDDIHELLGWIQELLRESVS